MFDREQERQLGRPEPGGLERLVVHLGHRARGLAQIETGAVGGFRGVHVFDLPAEGSNKSVYAPFVGFCQEPFLPGTAGIDRIRPSRTAGIDRIRPRGAARRADPQPTAPGLTYASGEAALIGGTVFCECFRGIAGAGIHYRWWTLCGFIDVDEAA